MRPSKRAQRKTEKAQQGLKEFLLASGKFSEDAIEKAFDAAPLYPDEKMLQAEGVLLHLIKPTRFISKKCKREECGQVFGTSYRAVAYCSDNCRAKDLESQTGIRWNPHVDRYQNLGGERPLIVGPQAYQVLIAFARHILQENNLQIRETDQTHLHQTEESNQSPALPEPESQDQLVSQQTDEEHTSPDISLLLSSDLVMSGSSQEDDPFGF